MNRFLIQIYLRYSNVLKVFTEIPAHFYFIYLYKESLGILGRWSDQIINTELLQCHNPFSPLFINQTMNLQKEQW